jgi:GT2 family glycosyltransferase
MGFLPDSVERLLARDLLIVGGLYFGMSTAYPDGYNGYRLAIFPQVYDRDEKGRYLPHMNYAKGALTKVDGTGSGFILIKREVFEQLDCNWYTPLDGKQLSEDLAFCERLRDAGIQLYVDTAIKATHHKSMWVSEDLYQPMTFGEEAA